VGDIQLVSGKRHAPETAGSLESAESIERWNAASHVSFPNNICSIISVFVLRYMVFVAARDMTECHFRNNRCWNATRFGKGEALPFKIITETDRE
jgi:hypothetical protein